jgi:hypothetical protein
MERSLSVRLGKFGITYTTQEGSSDQASSRKEVSSRPTTSFAQEFSLALARESGSTPLPFKPVLPLFPETQSPCPEPGIPGL